MTMEDFKARTDHLGEICFLCDQAIRPDQAIRYYGGPYLMHSACVQALMDERRTKENTDG